jgi:hypothetical protein
MPSLPIFGTSDRRQLETCDKLLIALVVTASEIGGRATGIIKSKFGMGWLFSRSTESRDTYPLDELP